MNELEIRLFGAPVVQSHGVHVPIARRQVRALLYYLATEMRPVARDHLFLLFWPDSPEAVVHREFSHLLTHLRRALPTANALEVVDNTIFLSPDHVQSDTATFLHLLGNRHQPPTVQQLEEAALLYQGSFLDGFSLGHSPEFEAWMLHERSVFERRYLTVLSTLARHYATQGDYAAALLNAQRYLMLEPFDEAFQQWLMQLHLEHGNRVAAIHQFDRYSQLLDEEIGVDPMPETAALYESAFAVASTPLRNNRELAMTR